MIQLAFMLIKNISKVISRNYWADAYDRNMKKTHNKRKKVTHIPTAPTNYNFIHLYFLNVYSHAHIIFIRLKQALAQLLEIADLWPKKNFKSSW